MPWDVHVHWSIRLAVNPSRAAYGAQWFFRRVNYASSVSCQAEGTQTRLWSFSVPWVTCSRVCLCHFVSRLGSYCISVGKIARRMGGPTKAYRQWNVLEIARLPLADLRTTMQFSRIMRPRRSFAAGNRIAPMEPMGGFLGGEGLSFSREKEGEEVVVF